MQHNETAVRCKWEQYCEQLGFSVFNKKGKIWEGKRQLKIAKTRTKKGKEEADSYFYLSNVHYD